VNLDRHLDVIWRHRAVAFGGVLLGVVLAVLAAYQLPSLERRGAESWSVESNILVTQPGFPEGRITLSETPSSQANGQTPAGSGQAFADPARLSSLALLYSVIADSDRVRSKLPGDPTRDQLQAIALDATGNGTTFLPIIQLTTTAGSADEAKILNVAGYETFKETLEAEQRANAIPPRGRVGLSLLNRPSDPLLLSGPSLAPSLLAFLLCCLGGLAAAHILEALSIRRDAARATADSTVHAHSDGGRAVSEPTELVGAGGTRSLQS
jgi:hypothetical protein